MLLLILIEGLVIGCLNYYSCLILDQNTITIIKLYQLREINFIYLYNLLRNKKLKGNWFIKHLHLMRSVN